MASPTNQPGQINPWQLKISYWYITNKILLKKILVGFLIAFSVLFYGYAIYKLLTILLIDDRAWRDGLSTLTQSQTNYAQLRELQKPQPLQIVNFTIVGGTDGKYDFLMKVRNPNLNFNVPAVVYQLIAGGQVIAEKTGFLLPGEEKYIGFFGQTAEGVQSATVKIADVAWKRYNNFSVFAQPRLRFQVSDSVFMPASESGVKGDLPVSILNYKITNTSAYSYWHVGVYMVLISADQVVGANYINLDQFKSGEIRDVEMRWYENLPGVSKVEIIPEVNIADPAAFMPVE